MSATLVLLFMAMPIGWLAALAIGAGEIVAGFAGSSLASSLYDTYGNKIDLASKTGVAQLCKG